MSCVWEVYRDEFEDGVNSPQIETSEGSCLVSIEWGGGARLPLRFRLLLTDPPESPVDILCCVEFLHQKGPDFGAPFSICAHFEKQTTESKSEEMISLASLTDRGFIDDDGNLRILIACHSLLKTPPSLGRLSSAPDPHELIRATLAKHDCAKFCPISPSDLTWLAYRTYRILMDQPPVLKLGTPLVVVGDLHGQFFDLLRIFTQFGFPNVTNYLFLGDIVDRGEDAVDMLVLLFAFKILYPNNLFIIRGNHECDQITSAYGFKNECCVKDVNYTTFLPVFDALPLAAVVGRKIFCIHGGIGPSFRSLSQLEEWKRPATVPTIGVVTDVLWSDPSNAIDYYGPNPRGTGYKFGQKAVEHFFKHTGIEMIVRAHECVDHGFDFPFGMNVNVVTVFSASGYSMWNSGAVMFIDDGLNYTFSQFPYITRAEIQEFMERDFNAAYASWTTG